MSKFHRTKNGKFVRNNLESSTPKKKMGRPSEYDNSYHPRVARVACSEMGATVAHLASIFDKSPDTVQLWMSTHEDFLIAIKEGREIYDTQRVGNTLLTRALGYPFTETKIKEIMVEGTDAEGETILVPAREVTTYNKQMAPNVTAMIFWLKNRQPERWRDVRAVDLNAKTEQTRTMKLVVEFKDMLQSMEVSELEALSGILSRAAKPSDGALTKPASGPGRADSVIDLSREEFKTLH